MFPKRERSEKQGPVTDLKRHRTNAIAMLAALAIVSLTVLTGLCIVQPPSPEGPCREEIMTKPGSGYHRKCPHSDHLLEDYGDEHMRCRCASRKGGGA